MVRLRLFLIPVFLITAPVVQRATAAEGSASDLAEIRKLIELLSESAGRLLDDPQQATPVLKEDRLGASVLLSYELTARAREDHPRTPFSSDEFELFIRTQAELLRSRELWAIVVRRPEVRSLPVVRAHKQDAALWLREHLRIERPAKTALLRVAFVGKEVMNERHDDLSTILTILITVYSNQAYPGHSFGFTTGRESTEVPALPDAEQPTEQKSPSDERP